MQNPIFNDMTGDFERAMFASVYVKKPAYAAIAPDIQAPRHVRAPSILENMRGNYARAHSGRPFATDTSSRMDGGIPEYAANMPSTSR